MKERLTTSKNYKKTIDISYVNLTFFFCNDFILYNKQNGTLGDESIVDTKFRIHKFFIAFIAIKSSF